MVTAVFTDNDDYARTYGLWQWDYGQQLRIEGLHLPTAVEIHFALQETGGEAIPRVGTTKDGVTTVTIPDSMLEGNRAAWTAEKAYNIYAWIYLSDQKSGETIKHITMQVKSRPKPKAFEAPGDGEIFREAIEAVNDAAKRAEEAGDKAIAAADEAEKAATQTAEHLEAVQGLAEQVETNADTVAQDKQAVTGMLSQAQQEASDAALSAQAAKLSETAAVQAQTGAEAAEDGARQYAEETEADRQAVANDKQAVTQMREAVAADRQAVEQTAAQFGQTSQDALTAIGQAQSTAVGAVEAEGQKQTTAVQEAGTQAVSEVTEAKTTAVEAVTTEGDTQTKRVEDAAAGIVADREQISQNKTDIAGLVEGMTDLAPAIHSTASGSVITANDATEGRPFRGLRVFGKSTQVRTTGAQLLPEQAVSNYFISLNGDIVGKNNSDYSKIIQNTENTTYYIFRKNVGTRFRAAYVDAIPTGNTPCTRVVDDTKDNISITVPAGKVLIINMEDTKAFDGLMVQKTRDRLPYEPYTDGKPSPSPEYKQEIVSVGEDGSITVEVRGKNLLPFPYADGMTKTTNGITFTVNTDRSITCTGTAINQAFFNLNRQKYTENPTDFNKYYSAVDCKYDHSNNITHISVSKSEGYINKTIYPMIVKKGETNLEYEPPRIPQSLTLQTPNGLPGIPVSKDGNYTDADGQQWICDEIDLGRGKYVQRVKDFIINRNTNISTSMGDYGAPEKDTILARYLDKTIKKLGAVLCRELICAKNWSNDSESVFATETSIDFRLSRKRLGLETETTTDENKTAVLKFLETTPLHGLVELNTPIERDLTPEEIAAYKALRTYGPTTVITNDAGAGMEATYVADTKAYIDKKFKELNQAIVNTQIALL
jgi:hypothetical protein